MAQCSFRRKISVIISSYMKVMGIDLPSHIEENSIFIFFRKFSRVSFSNDVMNWILAKDKIDLKIKRH